MKKFLLILFSFAFFTSAYSVNAQTPTDADGLFGKYFQRMVKDCKEQSEYHAVTGFALNPFGTIICTDIRDVLKKINGVTSIGTTTQLPGANVTINWPVMVTNPDISDDSLGNTLVTKKYVDENFSQVEAGAVIWNPGQIITVTLNKKFKNKPVVIAVIENFQFEHIKKVRQHCWKAKRMLVNRKTRCTTIDETPMVKIDLGATVMNISEPDAQWKRSVQIKIRDKVQDGWSAVIRYIAISSESPMANIIPSIINREISDPRNEEIISEKIKDFEKQMEIEEEEAFENQKQLEELKANIVPSKAIMPFYANACPVGWVAADGQNGTPDLRGEFIRGLDNGRGVDSGRGLGSFQGDAIRNITGFISGVALWFDQATGVFKLENHNAGASSWWWKGSDDFSFDASRVVPTANENRPRNVALLYCMKQ